MGCWCCRYDLRGSCKCQDLKMQCANLVVDPKGSRFREGSLTSNHEALEENLKTRNSCSDNFITSQVCTGHSPVECQSKKRETSMTTM